MIVDFIVQQGDLVRLRSSFSMSKDLYVNAAECELNLNNKNNLRTYNLNQFQMQISGYWITAWVADDRKDVEPQRVPSANHRDYSIIRSRLD